MAVIKVLAGLLIEFSGGGGFKFNCSMFSFLFVILPVLMGANQFLKLGRLELNSHGALLFLSPPSSYPSPPPNFRGLGY